MAIAMADISQGGVYGMGRYLFDRLYHNSDHNICHMLHLLHSDIWFFAGAWLRMAAIRDSCPHCRLSMAANCLAIARAHTDNV